MVSAATTEQEAVLARPASVARMFLDRVAATPEGGAYRRPVSGSRRQRRGLSPSVWSQSSGAADNCRLPMSASHGRLRV